MRTNIIFQAILVCALFSASSSAQTMPPVYDVQDTGANVPPYMPSSLNQLPVMMSLPDPFEWADGRGQIKYYSDWAVRRNEIGDQIQNYEIGMIPPRPDSITAGFSQTDSVLTVNVTVNGQTLTLTSTVVIPSGTGPFPVVIGMNTPVNFILPSSILDSDKIVQIMFNADQVTTYNGGFGGAVPSDNDPFYRLYPNLNLDNTGQYDAWTWGVSRLIDGLELVKNVLPIEMNRIAVAGCSYAGKMALFAGAFDERIALTVALESGGGGATSWRYSHYLDGTTVEEIDNTDYDWFENNMHQFAGDNVYRMPEDHNELMAMVAPRALYVTDNPSYVWLSNPSCYVASEACKQVYDAFGIPDRFGFSIIGGHPHCQVPDIQVPEIAAFVDKFLLGEDTASTSNIADNPYGNTIGLSQWIPWTNPNLTNGTSYFGRTSLVSPGDSLAGMDTTVTFHWNGVSGADEYYIEVTSDPTLQSIGRIDSTTDTTITVSGLMRSTEYYWRVQVRSAEGTGPWSYARRFSTAGPSPATPDLISATQDSAANGYLGYSFNWKKVAYADNYLFQVSNDSNFSQINESTSTSDTSLFLFGFLQGTNYYWRVQAINIIGSSPWSDVSGFDGPATAIKQESGIPNEFSLSQNYPNPFNPTTMIKFSLPERAYTDLTVFDVRGRKVKTLVNAELQAGHYAVTFDASRLSNGVYFYRIEAESSGSSGKKFVETKKLVLLK